MFEQSDRNTAKADTWRLLTILTDLDAAEYQLEGEEKPRSEPNLLKARLVRIETKLDKLLAAGGGVLTITDEQLERVLRKILIEGVGNPRTVA